MMSSKVTPGMMRSASVNARWSALSATRASCVETRGKSYRRRSHSVSAGLTGARQRRSACPWREGRTHRCDGGKHHRVEHGRVWEVVIDVMVVRARVRGTVIVLVARLAREPTRVAVADGGLLVVLLWGRRRGLRDGRKIAFRHDRRRRRI